MLKLLSKLFRQREKLPAFSPRAVRVRLLTEEAYFMSESGGKFALRNLSETGVGIEIKSGEYKMGDVLLGELHLPEALVPVQLRVVRQNKDVLGLQITKGEQLVRACIKRQFEEEARAAEMTSVNPGLLKKKEKGTPRWFFAPGNYELYYLVMDGKVLRMEMDLNGRIYACEMGYGLRVGVIAQENREKPEHAKTDLIEWRQMPTDGDRIKALRVLVNISGIADPELIQLEEMVGRS